MISGPNRTVSVSAMRSPHAATMVAEKTTFTRRSGAVVDLHAHPLGQDDVREVVPELERRLFQRLRGVDDAKHQGDAVGGQPADLFGRDARQHRHVRPAHRLERTDAASTVSSSMATSWA